ncbi:alpha/beta hydrolase family protein [Pontibacter harenae]|uniref:alpha/beta hydrolase family protein n=1 Tax=Pontibacter harenae TaxID=2894083 RepID=UPI001E4F1F44|nr:alpha/beta hydrolase [Pontibacter harenae]MCC9169037.1 alpha/beta hydrolase [Pontibacter harenae]
MIVHQKKKPKDFYRHFLFTLNPRFIFFIVALLHVVFPLSLLAQADFTGSWGGNVKIGSTEYPMIFHFQDGAKSKTEALFDMPSQGPHSNQAKISYPADSVRFTIDTFGGYWVYTARYSPEANILRGTILMGGAKYSLQVRPVDLADSKPPRPQTPQRPYPYREWDVFFPGSSPGIRLSGSITPPKGRKKLPGVVLLSGSGPHNRDGEQFYHKTFLVLADELTRRGFAVLRYDERGVGQSTGRYNGTTIYEFSQDAKAAVKALRSDPRLKVKDVYVIGHSQGSLEAQIVAAQDPAVAGIVLLAGLGLNGVEYSKTQYRAMLRVLGIPEEKAKAELSLYDTSYEIVGNAPDSATAVERLKQWHREAGIDSKSRSEFYIDPFVEKWRFDFLHMDPSPYPRLIKVPVFAVSGAKDSQVFVEKEFEAMEVGLKAGGNSKFKSEVLPNVNHFMQTAKKGTYDEPYALEETFSPEALHKIADWLEQKSKEKAVKAPKGQVLE